MPADRLANLSARFLGLALRLQLPIADDRTAPEAAHIGF
jgi:hypothetical protein